MTNQLWFFSENWSVTKECFSQISISYCTHCYKTAHTVLIISFKSHNFFYNIFSNFSFNCPRSSWGFQQKPPSITKFENWIRVSNVQLRNFNNLISYFLGLSDNTTRKRPIVLKKSIWYHLFFIKQTEKHIKNLVDIEIS